MLISGNSRSQDESRNWRVSIETRFRPSTYLYLPDLSWIAGAGGDHRPDPAPFPADDRTPSPPAYEQHSRQWRAENGWGEGTGERDSGSATAIGRCARESLPTPLDVAGRRRGVAGGMGAWNSRQRPGLRRRGAPVNKQTCSATEGRDRRPDAGYGRPQCLFSVYSKPMGCCLGSDLGWSAEPMGKGFFEGDMCCPIVNYRDCAKMGVQRQCRPYVDVMVCRLH